MGSSGFARSLLAIGLVLSLLLIEPAHVWAGSRKVVAGQKKSDTTLSKAGFKIELRHVDHGMNLSKFERLQRAVVRAKHRVQKLSMMGLATSKGSTTTSAIKSPIHPGNGEFLMNLAVGTPPIPYSAIIDTGSDLIWTQCEPCQQCYSQPSPIFNPANSSTYTSLSCNSDLCSALPASSCSDTNSDCTYSYEYGDYSSTSGTLASETFTFSGSKVSKIAFGCGNDNEGTGFEQGGGLVGLGRGPLSLVAQLEEPKFSYCLTGPDSNSTSTLLMGSLADVESSNTDTLVTPLAKNSAQPSFYYLNLEGISVGGTRVSIPKSTFAVNDDGSGGVIIDSGTTITYLEETAFAAVRKEFVKRTGLKVSSDGSDQTGLDLCFEAPTGSTEVEVPTLVFHFEKADLELPAENYMVGDEEDGVVCLAIGSSTGMSIFGNVQQQNKVVLYDLKKETVSFLGTKCEDL